MGANANWTNAGGPGVASNVKRAEKTLRRSLALDGDSAKTLRLLGVCVYQLGLVLQARLLPPAHCRPPPHSLRALLLSTPAAQHAARMCALATHDARSRRIGSLDALLWTAGCSRTRWARRRVVE